MSTQERWAAVKKLYAAVRPLEEEQRNRYLDQHCEDPDLRKEVEKLLLSESTVTSVEDAAPPGKSAEVIPPGAILGHYKIQRRLGGGGMGLVYEALDQKLQRIVAIKIIKPGAAGRDDRARFLREAQSVSALNHPNIVTVYEAGHHEGLDFIAMERVAGQTLQRKIGAKGIDTRTALGYAVQIADALAAAHEAGIVHRDLKPGNVMVTDRDVVKVLDFGLAKREAKQGETDEPLTAQGSVVGTYAYMSPEQAQGHAVDKRSDTFSFGSLLYEMVTGMKAFQEDSQMGTLAAVLYKDPTPLREVMPSAPLALARIISKSMQKRPHDRWQDMQDLKLVLSGLLEDLGGAPSGAAAAAPVPLSEPAKRRGWLGPAVIAAGAAVGALAMYVWMLRTQPAATLNAPVYRMVTAENGLNDYPALSRDGKLIAFASDRAGGGNLDIWLRQIGGREMIQLTKDPADETDPSFSPDGTHIAYRSERDGGGIYIVQTLGGDPVLLVRGGRNPRYSPDGKWVAYWTGRSEESTVPGSSKAYIIDATGGQPRQVHPEMSFAQFPIWSPGGDALLVYGMPSTAGSEIDYWVLPIDGGVPRDTGVRSSFRSIVLPTSANELDVRPYNAASEWVQADGGRLTFSNAFGDAANLWECSLDRLGRIVGSPQLVTRGPGRQMHASRAIADKVERLAFSDVSLNYDIWSAAANPVREDGAAARITNSVAVEWAPSISSDGRHLSFITKRGGSWALVLRDLESENVLRDLHESGHERVLVSSPSMLVTAAISGDGSRVVYTDIGFNLQATSTTGGGIEKLPGQRGTVLSLSADGRYVAYEPVKDEDVMIYDTIGKRSVTLAARQNSKILLSGTHLSPDGRRVAFHSVDHSTGRSRIWTAPVDLTKPAPAVDWIAVTDDTTFAQDPCWAQDGRTIYFASERDGFRCFWGQRIDSASGKPSGDPFAIRHFHSARQTLRGTVNSSYLTGLSAGGGRVFYSIAESSGTIWLEEKIKRGR